MTGLQKPSLRERKFARTRLALAEVTTQHLNALVQQVSHGGHEDRSRRWIRRMLIIFRLNRMRVIFTVEVLRKLLSNDY